MKLRRALSTVPDARRGAALMLALLVLFVLVAIAFQIRITTDTDARVGRNQIVQQRIDLAMESALLELFEQLALDGESSGGGDAAGAGDPLGAMTGNPLAGAGEDPGGGGAAAGASDSKMDDWARPQRSEINGVRLRILVQDEDSKLNVLSMLTENEEEASKAFERVIRVLEFCRAGTEYEIGSGEAREMAEQMRSFLTDRSNQPLPRPELVTDNPENEAIGLPLTLRELIVLPAFEEHHFRDLVDESGSVVHSIESFLTMWTGLSTAQELNSGGPGDSGPDGSSGTSGAGPVAGEGSGGGLGGLGGQGGSGVQGGSSGQGAESSTTTSFSSSFLSAGASGSAQGQGGPGALPGGEGGPGGGAGGGASGVGTPTGVAVNVNTASNAVLHALMDTRDVDPRFWDDVIAYRNEEEEPDPSAGSALMEEEELLDEWGNPILELQIFDDVQELSKVDGWENLEPIAQAELQNLLSVQSNVFSVYVTGRVMSGTDDTELSGLTSYQDGQTIESVERRGNSLSRTVRCIVWRRMDEESGEVELVPLVRWEPIDYVPWEVLDFPDDERTAFMFR